MKKQKIAYKTNKYGQFIYYLNTPKKLLTYGISGLIFSTIITLLMIFTYKPRNWFDILFPAIIIIYVLYQSYDKMKLGLGLVYKNKKIINEYNRRKPIIIYD